MLAILLALLAFVTGMNKYYGIDSDTKEARMEANENGLTHYNEMLNTEGLAEEDKQYYQDEIAIIEYRIAQDLPSYDAMMFSEHMEMSITLTIVMISIFAVVIAAGIVSSEFGTGTIKMLLTRPVARWKVLLSKLVTTILYGATLLASGLIFAYILGIILFNTDPTVSLSIVNGQVIEETVKTPFMEMILYSIGSILMTILFAFMIGTIFGSSTLAVSLSLFILLMGSTATMFIAKYDFAKYIWFANDLSFYAPGSMPLIEGLTFTFSLIVNIVYAIVFLAITFIYFMKRDITA